MNIFKFCFCPNCPISFDPNEYRVVNDLLGEYFDSKKVSLFDIREGAELSVIELIDVGNKENDELSLLLFIIKYNS